MPRNRSPKALALAREARSAPSVAEVLMWERLRNRAHGFKFRREHPIGPYRLDFYCHEARLAVEMDGEQHDPVRDQVRDEYLASLGIATHRIPNLRFFNFEAEAVVDEVEVIVALCRVRIEELRDGSCKKVPSPSSEGEGIEG